MDDFATGFLAGQDNSGGSGGGGNGGFGDFGGIWGILALVLILGGIGGFGGRGGGGLLGGGGSGGGDGVSAGFAYQTLDNGIRGIQQGLCDGFYAVNTGLLTGFNGVQSQIANCCCETQQAISTLGYQNQQCCCDTQRLIERGFCDIGNAINTQTRDIIDNQNANYRGIMDFMVQTKIDKLQSDNEALRLRASQADQNAVIRAAIDASTAEIIRRTGNDCPVPAYVVPNPNCCYGNPLGVGYNFGGGYSGNYGGNGCGCGCG